MTDESSNSFIMDVGSSLTKAGLSNEDSPRLTIPSILALGATNQPAPVKDPKDKKQPNITLSPIMTRGKVNDWNNFRDFLSFLSGNELELDLSERAVITNHYGNTSKLDKEIATQLFFEVFNVPFYYTAPNSLLALYSSGRQNGLVLESGDQITSVTPILEGCPMTFAQTIVEFGGMDITQYISNTLNKDFAESKMLKERYAKVPMDFEKDLVMLKEKTEDNKLVLPDNTNVELDRWILDSAEGNFNPSAIGLKGLGVHELVYESLSKTDYEYRKELTSNIILTGGNTKIPNFYERFNRDLGFLLSSIVKMKSYNQMDKINSVWFGGSIVSNLGIFQPLLISRSDYDEVGPSIVNRKCF